MYTLLSTIDHLNMYIITAQSSMNENKTCSIFLFHTFSMGAKCDNSSIDKILCPISLWQYIRSNDNGLPK